MTNDELNLTFDISGFKKAFKQAKNISVQFVDGLKKGFQDANQNVKKFKNKVKAMADGVTAPFKKIGKVTGKVFSPMLKGVKKVAGPIKRAIGGIFKKTGEMAEKAKEKAGGVLETFAKFTMIGTIIGGVGNLISKALNAIPEVGKTFEIVGEIIKKNLLWPLRKTLIPLLQKVLDWVRDNRGLFVKWGGVIVNIFKMIQVGFTAILGVAKAFVKGFVDSLKGGLFKGSRDITDFVNLVTFKLTAIMSILGVMLKPFASAIGETIGTLVNLFGDLFDSMADLGLLDAFGSALKAIGEIASAAFIASLEAMKAAFKGLGALLKGVVKGFKGVDGFGESWSNLADKIKVLYESMGKLFKLLQGDKVLAKLEEFGEIAGKVAGGALKLLADVLGKVVDGIGAVIGWAIEKLEDKEPPKGPTHGGGSRSGKVESVNDAIIKPDGTIIRTHPDDTIVATKNKLNHTPSSSRSQAGPGSRDISVKVEGFNVNVVIQGDSDAKKTGTALGDSMGKAIKKAIVDELNKEGKR